MDKIALVTFGRGLLYNVIFTALYYYYIRHKCEGLTCFFTMIMDIIFIIVCQIYWIGYSLYMDKQCPGSGYLILFYYIIHLVHYYVAKHLMTRKVTQINVKIQNIREQQRMLHSKRMDKEYSDVIEEQLDGTEPMNEEHSDLKQPKISVNEEHSDLIKQRSEVKSRFNKHLMYSSAFYFVVFILVLAFYKCKSE